MTVSCRTFAMRWLSVAVVGSWLASCGSSPGGSGAGRGGVDGTAGEAGGSGGSSAARGGGTETAGNGGSAGAIGTAGTSGFAGMSGSAGAGGSASSGSAAAGGTSGANGSAGASGAAGDAGTAGAAATSGAGGSAGTAGRGGTTGTAGTGGRGGGGGAGTGGAGVAGADGGQCPTTATATPGDKNESITVGGMTRTFVRHVPSGYTGKTPVPVVIDFHPLGGTGSSWKGSTNWGSVADSQGFIMIWPDGVGNSWNVGRCCSTAQSQNVDDVAFTKAIVTTLETEACIDRKRVYATGCSNGGGMAFKVACDAADVIAAVAPVDFDCVTGSTATPSCGMCAPARPISEIQFRGTSDTAVPYNGGSGPRGTMFPGGMENFTEWGGIDMCTGSPQPLSGHSGCQEYAMCGGGAEAILCTVQNGTHCGNYQSFGIVNIAWEVFKRNALP